MFPLLDLEMRTREREIADRAEKQRVRRENGVAFEPMGFVQWLVGLVSKPQSKSPIAVPQTAAMVSSRSAAATKNHKKKSA